MPSDNVAIIETINDHSNRLDLMQACIKRFERDLFLLTASNRHQHTENIILRDAIRQVNEYLRGRVSHLRGEENEDEALSMTAIILTLEMMLTVPKENEDVA